MRSLIPIFIQNKIQYIVSPYLATAQLAWFSEKEYVNSVYGGYDLLPFSTKIPKIIIDIDFTVNRKEKTDKQKHKKINFFCTKRKTIING